MTNANAEYQREWRKRHAKAIRLHRQMLAPLNRLHQVADLEVIAWDLAKLLRECCGEKNAAYLAHWLQDPKGKRPGIDSAVAAALAAALKRKPPPK